MFTQVEGSKQDSRLNMTTAWNVAVQFLWKHVGWKKKKEKTRRVHEKTSRSFLIRFHRESLLNNTHLLYRSKLGQSVPKSLGPSLFRRPHTIVDSDLVSPSLKDSAVTLIANHANLHFSNNKVERNACNLLCASVGIWSMLVTLSVPLSDSRTCPSSKKLFAFFLNTLTELSGVSKEKSREKKHAVFNLAVWLQFP